MTSATASDSVVSESSAAAASSEVAALPDIDADTYFDGKAGGTFGKNVNKLRGHSNRVAVAGFRVVFITEAEAAASVRASYLPVGTPPVPHVEVGDVDNATNNEHYSAAANATLEQATGALAKFFQQHAP